MQESECGRVAQSRAAGQAAMALLWLAFASPAPGADEVAVAPGVRLTPLEVVTVQLEALRHNDVPYPDAGIAQTWALAHPDNKAFTGPLARFAGMVHGPQFRAMLNHHSHTIEEVARSDTQVTFLVLVEDNASRAVGYEWTLEKVRDGEHAGCWMTTAVSPPVPFGNII